MAPGLIFSPHPVPVAYSGPGFVQFFLFVLIFALISGTFSGYFLRSGCRPAWLQLALTRAPAVRPSSALCCSRLAAFFVVSVLDSGVLGLAGFVTWRGV